jgi:hypothetical protein
MAKQAKATSGATPARPARGARSIRQAKAAKKRRDQNLLIGAGAAFIVLLIAVVVFLNVRNSRPVVGEEMLSSQGNYHIEFGSPPAVEYNSTPPSSGPHYGNLAAWNIYDTPQRYELLLHNLEDGGVIVYYQCEDGCPEMVDQLKTIVEPYLNAGRHVVMAPNDPNWTAGAGPLHQDMDARIAVVAWTRVLKLDEVDEVKIRTFIDRYEGIDHHVAGIG